jgi:NAD(P)-dependent dehydrogenase (short-subunit alcohol dehydrogenase family)
MRGRGTSDVARRTIIITGGSDGIGAAAARQLSAKGEQVVLVGRSPEKTKAVATDLDVDFFVADFSELTQVRALATELRERYPRIDVLANNAGGMLATDRPTSDGHESVLQVNYLAPFLLTSLLMDRLIESRGAVIGTSSASQSLIRGITVDDLLHTDRVGPSKAYALSKIAVVLFTRELHHRYHADGLTCASFHPGWVDSNFGPASSSRFIALLQATRAGRIIGKTPDEGADQLVWLCSTQGDRDWQSGEYYVKRRIGKSHRLADDPTETKALWERSLTLLADIRGQDPRRQAKDTGERTHG